MKTSKTIYILVGVLLFSVLFLTNCNQDFEEIPDDISKIAEKIAEKSGKSLIEISYEMISFRDFTSPSKNLTKLDLATINPSSDKHLVKMELYESGQLNITIDEVLDFKEKVKIRHKTLPNDIPPIVKTVITGNSVTFYDKSGNVLGKDNIDIPNQLETVKIIKSMGKEPSLKDLKQAVSTIQGYQLGANLETYIAKASQNGVKVMEQGEDFVTLRTSFKDIDARIEEEAVLLINKKIEKLVGSRIYNSENELLQSTLYGYTKDKMLNAIKVEQEILLPSGKKIIMEINTKIDNLSYNLNIN